MMKLVKVQSATKERYVGCLEHDEIRPLDLTQVENVHNLSDILHSPDPAGLAGFLVDQKTDPASVDSVRLLAPIDRQEVWAAGVTYKRSRAARMQESESAASHYDRVYDADRPELFFKATPHRVSGPGEPVRVRSDSAWSVPEPEYTLIVSPAGDIVGYTIGNDMSARDIEGENPLYLPQAKFYRQCCALGPAILLAGAATDPADTRIVLRIERAGRELFRGDTSLDRMARDFADLVSWLTRENDFPDGAFLLTGTGIVPPDEFTCQDGDVISIDVTGIGTLENPVVKSAAAG